jgi:hypothetical protein
MKAAMQVRIRNTWCFGAIELNINATQRQLPKLHVPLRLNNCSVTYGCSLL